MSQADQPERKATANDIAGELHEIRAMMIRAKRSHRAMSYAYLACGIVMLPLGFLHPAGLNFALAGFLIGLYGFFRCVFE